MIDSLKMYRNYINITLKKRQRKKSGVDEKNGVNGVKKAKKVLVVNSENLCREGIPCIISSGQTLRIYFLAKFTNIDLMAKQEFNIVI